jgi:small-conductance mechanosensitive channel
MYPSRRFRLLSKYLNAVVLLLTLVLGLWLAPAIAQTTAQASIVLDGQQLFQISNSGRYSAQERAKLINSQLKNAVQFEQPIPVKIEQRNQLPTILLNNRYLLTVTEQDAALGSTPNEQASIWSEQIQQALQQAQFERTTTYLRRTTLVAVGILLLTAIFSWLLGWIKHHFLRGALQRLTPPIEGASDSGGVKALQFLFKSVLAIARIGLWVGVVLYITNLFPFTRQESYQITNILVTSLTSPIFKVGKNPYSITELVILIGLLFGLVIFAGTATNLLRSRLLNFAGINRSAQQVIAMITKYSLIFIGTLVILQVWGVDISSLAILASGLGVGIGFGLQDIAKNFGSGLVLVFERPIELGDFVEVGEYKGIVERMGPRSTEIRTLDHVSIIVPNSRFLEKEVINWSHRNPISRIHLPVGVAYGSDPKAVQAALLEAANKHSSVLENPSPLVLFNGLGDSSLNFELLVWTAEPNKQFLLKSDLYYNIYEVLQQQKIEIPFPQIDLHMRSGTLGLSPEIESSLTQVLEQIPHNGLHIDPTNVDDNQA